MKTIICDIDGVLSDDSKRIHYLLTSEKDYNSFYSEIPNDTPIQESIDLLKTLTETHFIILLTGRPEKYRLITEKWLKKYGVPYNLLYMRKTDDHRPNEVVKQEIYENEIKNHIVEITAIFEDSTKVVEMWRSLGLPCWQNTTKCS